MNQTKIRNHTKLQLYYSQAGVNCLTFDRTMSFKIIESEKEHFSDSSGLSNFHQPQLSKWFL